MRCVMSLVKIRLCRYFGNRGYAAPGYANWPTFPQLWVDGELVGGCDIITEMFESGELETLLTSAASRISLYQPPR